MALSDKNIVITPNNGQSSDPQIVFSGADASTGAQNITVKVTPLNQGTLDISGSDGTIASFSDLSIGSVFSVSDSDGNLLLDVNESLNLNEIRSKIPAVTHVDYSARVQTVNKSNGKFYNLIKNFYKKTDCPVIINTSFNLNREPIVGTIRDAYQTFLTSGLDLLVCENSILYKEKQYEKFN